MSPKHVLVPVIAGLLVLACTKARLATYQMDWHYEDDHTCPTMRHVILQFVDYPAYSYGYCSDELASYLSSLHVQRVQVVFSIWAPDAQLGGGNPISVGSLKHWRSEFQHMGFEQTQQDIRKGLPVHHPWERVRGAT